MLTSHPGSSRPHSVSRRAAPASRAAARSSTRRALISAPSRVRHLRRRVLPFETRAPTSASEMRWPASSNQITNAQPSRQREQPQPRLPATSRPCLQRGHGSGRRRGASRGRGGLGGRRGLRAGASAGGGPSGREVPAAGAGRGGGALVLTIPAPPRMAVTTSPHIARDVRHEGGAGLLAARHAREARLPGAGQLGRAQALDGERLDEPDAHLRRHQVLAVARDERPPDERLDRRGPRRRRAQARVAHGGAQLLVGDVAAGRFHGARAGSPPCGAAAVASASSAPRRSPSSRWPSARGGSVGSRRAAVVRAFPVAARARATACQPATRRTRPRA